MVSPHFIQKWSMPGYPALPVDPAALDAIETHFRFKYPLEFRTRMLRFGLPQHIGLFLHHSILKANLDIIAVNAFIEPDEVIEYTQNWREYGLPADCVAFAVDDFSNVFCFQITDRHTAPPTAPVWHFIFESKTTTRVAPSFTEWIARFCEVEFVDLIEGDE